MILHGLFAECVNRAPGLILANPNYVKKVVFPLEILPCVAMGSAVFHGGISLAVMLLAQLAAHGTIPWTIVLIPFVLLPLLCTTLGLAWFLSALGVYFRDVIASNRHHHHHLICSFPRCSSPSPRCRRSFKPGSSSTHLTLVI